MSSPSPAPPSDPAPMDERAQLDPHDDPSSHRSSPPPHKNVEELRAALAEERAARAKDRAALAKDRAALAEERAARAEDRAALDLANQQVKKLTGEVRKLRSTKALQVYHRQLPAPSSISPEQLEGVVFRGNLALCEAFMTIAQIPFRYQQLLSQLAEHYPPTAEECGNILSDTAAHVEKDYALIANHQQFYDAEATINAMLQHRLMEMFSRLKGCQIMCFARPRIHHCGKKSYYAEPDILVQNTGNNANPFPVVMELGTKNEHKMAQCQVNCLNVMQNMFFQERHQPMTLPFRDQCTLPSEDSDALLPRPIVDPSPAAHPVLGVSMTLVRSKRNGGKMRGTLDVHGVYPMIPVGSDSFFSVLDVPLWRCPSEEIDRDIITKMLLSVALFSASGFTQPVPFEIKSNVYFRTVNGEEFCYKYFSSSSPHTDSSAYSRDYTMYLQPFAMLGACKIFPEEEENAEADDVMEKEEEEDDTVVVVEGDDAVMVGPDDAAAEKDAEGESQMAPEEDAGVVIRYPTVKGNHIATSTAQFRPILAQLKTMHESGYVHGDIRLANMIFHPEDHSQSRLIDFDMAGIEGQRVYPPGFVIQLEDTERHKDAQPGAHLRREHDLHSMTCVMRLFEADDNTTWNSLISPDEEGTFPLESHKEDFDLSIQEHLKMSQYLVGAQFPVAPNPPGDRVVQDAPISKKRRRTETTEDSRDLKRSKVN